MLIYWVLLPVHKLLGALGVVWDARLDSAGLRRLGAIGVYRRVREEILRSDDRRFGRAVKPLISMTWEELQSILVCVERCEAEIVVGLFELESDELLWYGHGRRHCNVSDAFDMEAYSITWSTPTAQSPRAHIHLLDDPFGILHVQHRTKGDAAMVYVEYNFADQEHELWVRCEFFLRTFQ